MDELALKKRIESILKSTHIPKDPRHYSEAVMATMSFLQGSLTIMSAVYGPESLQVKTLDGYSQRLIATNISPHIVAKAVEGSLKNLQAEIDEGFAGSLQKKLQGEILTDFIQLARAVLEEPGDGAKNVAAVLAAAAFEDTIRKMGAVMAGVVGKDDLSDIITALKTNGILVSPQLGIAQSYLNFRNRALHANWDEIQLETVHSVLGFVEQLLLRHFQ